MSSGPPARNGVPHQVSPPSPLLESSIPIDDGPVNSILEKNYARGQTQKNERDRCQETIDILPDDILLCIFNAYLNGLYEREEWPRLVHVCRRWRSLVFGSPHHLNLKLFCSIWTPVTKKLDIWPSLPIVVDGHSHRGRNLDNLIAAIKHNDRVCEIDLRSFFGKWPGQLEKIVSVMKVPFPALTSLNLTLRTVHRTAPVLPDLFLGRSAPRLQHLALGGVSFPGLPNLLLSAAGLVSLELRRIPHSWNISPNVMVAHLFALTRLESLLLSFEFCRSHPDRDSHHSPPSTRTLIPALTWLKFEGANEYAEDLVTRIDTPRLDSLDITFFNETVFDISNLSQFISCRVPQFQAPPDGSHVTFFDDHITAELSFSEPRDGRLMLGILCDESAGQLSSLIQLCRPLLPAFSTVERLYICQYGDRRWKRWRHGIQDSHWLQLLQLFTDAKDLYVSHSIAKDFVPVLNGLVGERTTEVLPALQNVLFYKYETLLGPITIDDFISARKLSGHPVAVSCSDGYSLKH